MCIRLHILEWVFALLVPTDDALATVGVKCYNCIVRLSSLPSFTETIDEVYCNDPWLAKLADILLNILLKSRKTKYIFLHLSMIYPNSSTVLTSCVSQYSLLRSHIDLDAMLLY